MPLANNASTTIFDFKRGELVFFGGFLFFLAKPYPKSQKFYPAGKRSSFFFGPKKVFFEPKKLELALLAVSSSAMGCDLRSANCQ